MDKLGGTGGLIIQTKSIPLIFPLIHPSLVLRVS